MCADSIPAAPLLYDPRDEIFIAARALRGLLFLLMDRETPLHGDSDLAALVDVIDHRLHPAATMVQDYVPRGFVPPPR